MIIDFLIFIIRLLTDSTKKIDYLFKESEKTPFYKK